MRRDRHAAFGGCLDCYPPRRANLPHPGRNPRGQGIDPEKTANAVVSARGNGYRFIQELVKLSVIQLIQIGLH